MILTYCSIMFQLVTYWDAPPIHVTMKDYNCKHITEELKAFNYVSPEYEHEVQTWGVCLRDREPVKPEQLLTELSYFINFVGDGKVCR